MSPAPRRLYLDNAATSFPKPSVVHQAVANYATNLGASAGRGAYHEAIETGQLIAQCRQRLNQLFNAQNPSHFIFTLNCSDALNLGIKGLLNSGLSTQHSKLPHAICTHIDHNSILRPLGALQDRNECEVTRIPIDPATGLVDPDDIKKSIRPSTRLIAITHASNVTGTIQPIREIGTICRQHDIPFLVDAAQSAGHIPVDVQADNIDLLAAPGHKALLGPLGTGLLYIRPGLEQTIRPLREGGTGSVSENDRQPDFMPDKFEPGSHNAIGIIGLSEGIQWILQQGIEKLAAHDLELVRTFLEGVSGIEGLTYYGPQGVRNRLGVFSVRIEGLEPYELSAILESSYGILTRPGLHCAPLAHNAINTTQFGGTTRFSFGPFLSKQDIKFATDALAEIATTARPSAPKSRAVV
jgi:cysteine desulfurase/selenocysteine lyase